MRREGDDAIARQVGVLHHLLIGVLAEMQHLGRIEVEGLCNRFELVGRVRQTRQPRELGAIDPRRAHDGAPAQRHTPHVEGCDLDRLLLVALRLQRLLGAEVGIAEADQRLALGRGRRQLPQRTQGRRRRHDRHRVAARQPGDIAIARKQRPLALFHLGWRRRQQRQRQQPERAVGDHDQALRGLPRGLDRPQQQRIELMRQCHVEGWIVRQRRCLRLERFAQRAHLGLDRPGRDADRRERRRPVLRYGPHEAPEVAEVERQHGLTRPHGLPDPVQRRRLGIDQLGV